MFGSSGCTRRRNYGKMTPRGWYKDTTVVEKYKTYNDMPLMILHSREQQLEYIDKGYRKDEIDKDPKLQQLIKEMRVKLKEDRAKLEKLYAEKKINIGKPGGQ
jgi:hypothetical protein